MRRRRESAKHKIEEASKSAKGQIGDSEDVREFKELAAALFEKLERMAKLGGDYTVTYPLIRERKSDFRLVNIRPKIGEEIQPDLWDRLAQPLTHKLLEVRKWPDYQGVEANISYASVAKKTVRHIVFNPVKNEPCSIKTVTVLWRDEESGMFKAGMGHVHLRNDTDEEQIFELPYVETKALRLVVNENWGDQNCTCFEGVKVYQT